MNIDDVGKLTEELRRAQELLDQAGLGNRRSALDPDPRLLLDALKSKAKKLRPHARAE